MERTESLELEIWLGPDYVAPNAEHNADLTKKNYLPTLSNNELPSKQNRNQTKNNNVNRKLARNDHSPLHLPLPHGR